MPTARRGHALRDMPTQSCGHGTRQFSTVAPLAIFRRELFRAVPEAVAQSRGVVAKNLLCLSQAILLELLAPVVDERDQPLVDVGQAPRNASRNLCPQH